MKLCLSARQDSQYLDLADEIIFEYRDRSAIPEYIEKYPDKTIILTCLDLFAELDWEEINDFNILADYNFLFGFNNLEWINNCIDYDIDFYLAYPINSYDELNTVLYLGSSYVRLGTPLFFDLDNVKKFYPNAKIRIIPNIAYDDAYPRQNGVAGTWIRPEDLMMYDPYVTTVEFNDINPKKEQALVRIYWQERQWPGDLQTLITNLQYTGVNRLIPSDVTEKRLNCRQRCMSHKNCHICQTALQLANPSLITEYKEALDANQLELLDN